MEMPFEKYIETPKPLIIAVGLWVQNLYYKNALQ